MRQYSVLHNHLRHQIAVIAVTSIEAVRVTEEPLQSRELALIMVEGTGLIV